MTQDTPTPYTNYRNFCSQLKSLKNTDFVCYGDYEYLLKEEKNKQGWFDFKNFDLEKDRKRFFLRHDIDKDPIASLKLAKIESEFGIRSTFFYLYSGTPQMKIWRTDKKIIPILKEIQDLGHEVGLHYDIYGDYFVGGIDCSVALENALSFMRTNGIRVRGCCAHSAARVRALLHAGVHTPEKWINWNIWKEINSNMPKEELKCNNKILMSPHLSLLDHGLEYEAYYVCRQRPDYCYVADAGTKPDIRKGLWNSGFIAGVNRDVVQPRLLEKTIGLLSESLENKTVNVIAWLTHPYLWERGRWPV